MEYHFFFCILRKNDSTLLEDLLIEEVKISN